VTAARDDDTPGTVGDAPELGHDQPILSDWPPTLWQPSCSLSTTAAFCPCILRRSSGTGVAKRH
jgi:hypothetical protein